MTIRSFDPVFLLDRHLHSTRVIVSRRSFVSPFLLWFLLSCCVENEDVFEDNRQEIKQCVRGEVVRFKSTQSKGEGKRMRRRWSGLKQLKTETRSELFFSVVLQFRFPRRFVPFRGVCLSLAMDDVEDEVVDVLWIPFVDLEVF